VKHRLSPIEWLICAIAAIGFAFDIYEILMLPLIVRPALLELTGAAPGSPEFQMWVGRLFYIPAFAGGIFGLLGGYLTDRLGRRRNIWLFALLSAVCVLAYANIPHGADTLLLVLGFPLGFCMSAIFSGFGSYLSELYPTAVRGTGQGFTYNTGRAVGAIFPTLVGFLADSWGVGGALVFGAVGYGLAALALLGLPETRGKELA